MSRPQVKYEKRNEQPFRLVPSDRGCHKFGGTSFFNGLFPTGCEVPVQQLLLIDLSDSLVPFDVEPSVKYLPLFYPFKYGIGGPEIQYAVVSDSAIEILFLSDSEPEEAEWQYLQVAELPEQHLALEPLAYEEARCLTFMRENGFFQPDESDSRLLSKLDVNNLMLIGGQRNHIVNAPDIYCRNPACERNGERTHYHFLASIPPVPINGKDDFWHEFQGGEVEFCFVICYFCGTIIGFNVAG